MSKVKYNKDNEEVKIEIENSKASELLNALHDSMRIENGGFELQFTDKLAKCIDNTNVDHMKIFDKLKHTMEEEYYSKFVMMQKDKTGLFGAEARLQIRTALDQSPDFMTKILDLIRGLLGFEKSHAGTKIKDWANKISDNIEKNPSTVMTK